MNLETNLPPDPNEPHPTVDLKPETITLSSAPSDRSSGILRDIVETVLIALALIFVFRLVLQNFRVEGFSMEPNFHDGQYILVNKVEYLLRAPQRGEVIVLIPPASSERDIIKRIIALPGDRIEISNNQISINGKIISEPYLPNPLTYTLPPLTVPPDSYFVLGDNRDYSNDSHLWGTVSREKIVGKAWLIYWPLQYIGFISN